MRVLAKFFSLTFAVTWLAWLAAARLPAPARSFVVLIGVFAPAIVALSLTAMDEGRDAAWVLVRRIGRWRVPARYYAFALGYMAAIKLAVAVLIRITTGEWPRFGETSVVLMAIAIVTSAWAQAGEEIGWRGYALPRLTQPLGLGPASVALGVIWALWHLPLFFILGGDTAGQSFPLYVLQLTAISVALAWLYWRTSGSLLLVMLMHAAINNTKDIVPSAAPGATNPFATMGTLQGQMTVMLLWIGAAYFLTRMSVRRSIALSCAEPGTPG